MHIQDIDADQHGGLVDELIVSLVVSPRGNSPGRSTNAGFSWIFHVQVDLPEGKTA